MTDRRMLEGRMRRLQLRPDKPRDLSGDRQETETDMPPRIGTLSDGYTEKGGTRNFRPEEKVGVLMLVEMEETISERKAMPPEQKRK
jgi:hypothetical protein